MKTLLGLVSSLISLTLSSAIYADNLGVHGGIGYWAFEAKGDVINNVSIQDNFDIKDESGLTGYLAFEHPVPLIPNIRGSFTEISDETDGNVLATNFVFNGVPFVAGQTVNTELDLSHADVTFYYELIDVGFDADLGITARYYSGDFSIDSVREDFDTWVPLLYGSIKLGLPLSGLYVGADFNGDGDIIDYSARVGWATDNFIFPEFGIEAGYRNMTIDASSSKIGVGLDTDVAGAFVNLTAHF